MNTKGSFLTLIITGMIVVPALMISRPSVVSAVSVEKKTDPRKPEEAAQKEWPDGSHQAQQGQELKGAWIVNMNLQGFPPFQVLVTFTPDGSVLVSQEDPLETTGHGEWVRTGDREYRLAYVAFHFDEKDKFIGTLKFRGSLKLKEAMDEYTGLLKLDFVDPSGKLAFSSDATVQGKRIRVEPLE